MKNKFIKIIRSLLLFPFKILLYAANTYSKVLSIIDPNGSERYWEELSQQNINNKINSSLKYKNLNNFKTKKKNLINKLKFFTPNKITSHRVYTILSKEIETIKWIEKNGSARTNFFDIGANIALYSIVFSKIFKSKSFCFEPNYLNNNLIQKNIKINNLNKFISIIPNPLYSKNKFDFFSQNSQLAGMAEATFGKKNFYNNYRTLSLTLDEVANLINLKKNSCLLKIDVDGNELEIIKGASMFLKLYCRSALIEVSNKTKNKINYIMKSLGFLKKKTVFRKTTTDEFWFKKI